VRDGRFELRFGDLMETDRPDLCTHGPWPVVKLYGEDLAVIAVNSARPNPQPWRSSGRIPDAQLAGLERALGDGAVRGRFVIVVTHYAPRLESGVPDGFRHGLVNYAALEEACRGMRRGLIGHGHLHECFHTRSPKLSVPLFCAGSATDEKHGGFWIYELDGAGGGRALRGGWNGEAYALDGTVVPLS
ncbi:MAG: metallophosphoesterase, partial [Myxococcales bacterium]|nr:metallophosphoesterase [Myxococcales bacterium]